MPAFDIGIGGCITIGLSFSDLNKEEQDTCKTAFFFLGGRHFCESLFPYLEVCVAYDLVKGLDILGILNLAVLSISAEYAHNFYSNVEMFQVTMGINLLVTHLSISVVNHEWSVDNGHKAYPPPAPPPGGGSLLAGNFEEYEHAHLNAVQNYVDKAHVTINSWAFQPAMDPLYRSLSGWIFSATAGVSYSSTRFFGLAANGNYLAFLNLNATLCTTITALLPGVTYSLSWASSQQSGFTGNDLMVTVDSFVLYKTGPMSRTSWLTDGPFSFVPTATSSQLCFKTSNPYNQGGTTLVDNVVLRMVGASGTPPPPFGLALLDGSFEVYGESELGYSESDNSAMWAYAKPANTVTAGGYNSSSVWALTSTAGVSGTSGLSNSASRSSGWGAAHDGSFFLFLQHISSACQTMSLLSGSTYNVSWFQAMRANYNNPTLVVTVGTSVLYNSTTAITSSAWYSPGTKTFTATSSSMQLCFSNTVSAGDATTLLDQITVVLAHYPTQPPPAPPPRGLSVTSEQALEAEAEIYAALVATAAVAAVDAQLERFQKYEEAICFIPVATKGKKVA